MELPASPADLPHCTDEETESQSVSRFLKVKVVFEYVYVFWVIEAKEKGRHRQIFKKENLL